MNIEIYWDLELPQALLQAMRYETPNGEEEPYYLDKAVGREVTQVGLSRAELADSVPRLCAPETSWNILKLDLWNRWVAGMIIEAWGSTWIHVLCTVLFRLLCFTAIDDCTARKLKKRQFPSGFRFQGLPRCHSLDFRSSFRTGWVTHSTIPGNWNLMMAAGIILIMMAAGIKMNAFWVFIFLCHRTSWDGLVTVATHPFLFSPGIESADHRFHCAPGLCFAGRQVNWGEGEVVSWVRLWVYKIVKI